MTTFSRFLLLPALLTAGLSAVQAQSLGSASDTYSVPTKAASGRPALLRLGVGASVNGSGDYNILKAHLEYAPQLGRRWRLASRLAYVGGAEAYRVDEQFAVSQSYRAANAEQEIHWLPFGAGQPVEVGIGGGFFAGYGQSVRLVSAGSRLDAAGGREYFSVTERVWGLHVGYLASLYVDAALGPDSRWRLGGRVALQNDTRANILPGAQLQLSRVL